MRNISLRSCFFLSCFIGFMWEGSCLVLVKNLDEDIVVTGNEKKISEKFDIYCYNGRLKHIINMWETVQLHISLPSDEYTLFDGYNTEEVKDKYNQQKTTWNFNIFTKRQTIKLNPFNQTCVGIIANDHYEIKLHRIRVDYWRILLCFCGFFLFLFAPTLSVNSLFYYFTGISFGMFASLLILVYCVSRLMPRKPLMYSFLAGGWTIGIYLVQLIWDNVRIIVVDYKTYVVYYFLATGLISFIICYRFGPVSDPKNINLIKWALQGIALSMIFFSSDFQEAAMCLNFVVLIYYNLPVKAFTSLIYRIKKWWFPPKPSLLTEDEYHQQGVIETERALETLRGYCSSPECNQWKTILRLKDPLRFAKFMEGSSHLQDEEVLAFETEDTDNKELRDSLLTDDSSSSG